MPAAQIQIDPCLDCPHRPRLALLTQAEAILRRYVEGDEWERLNLYLDHRDLRREMTKLGTWE